MSMTTRDSTFAVTPAPAAGAMLLRRLTLREPLLRCLVPVLLIAVWQLASSLGVASEFVLPSPASVLAAYRELWQSGDLQDALKVSLARAALGLLIGGGAGMLLGVASGLSKSAERGFDSVLQMLRTIPFIALVPIFVVWFGIGEVSKVALIVGAAISPMYLSTYHAIRGIDPKLLELGRTFRLTRAHQVRLIILPMSLPGILVGVRYAAAISLLALVAAEQINASAGIGYILNNANQFQRTDIIIAGILVYAALGISVDALLRYIERKALAWRGAHV
ncbi:binding-protein-dependent transport systems inner membrane component [Paraburkholderia atlantica]|uniref:Binding-protein-dependent transport systems inner membrane component n=1 Tax=Paraburkholderia atlantica TaxID=2654982 RepID=D5WK29_PARAM|nr:ABC transporter permease [Paraburkholderia atlantica]ADG19575.1 binding-protein-dependent transport systems inner membrane component [Paraburkholderia atlantica]